MVYGRDTSSCEEETKTMQDFGSINHPQINAFFPYTPIILSRSTEEQRDLRARTPHTTSIYRRPTYICRHHMKNERR